MNTLFFIAVVGVAALLLRSLFPPTNDSEYVLVPVPVQRSQHSVGCIPMLVLLLIALLVLAFLFGNTQAAIR